MNKKIIAPLLAVAAVSIAVPAAAQNYGPPRGGPGYHAPAWQSIAQRKVNLDRRIDRAAYNRAISPREANSLRRTERHRAAGGPVSPPRPDPLGNERSGSPL